MTATDWRLLSFEDRQRAWQGHVREFRQLNGRADKPTVWQIWVQGDRVFSRHGQLDGAMQETSYQGRVKNKGRANEISAEQDALSEARRDCRKKWDFEGFDEFVGGEDIDNRNTNKDLTYLLNYLPGSFCLYKPQNNLLECSSLLKKANKGEVLYTVKRDGVALLIVIDPRGNIVIYSRRARAWPDTEGPTEKDDGTLDWSTVRLWSQRFPHIVESVQQLGFPPNTMLAGELVASPEKDDFPFVSGLTKGGTERALEDMSRRKPYFYWWDIPFYMGTDLTAVHPVQARYDLIKDLCQKHRPKYILPIDYTKIDSVEEAISRARQNKIEGWVVVDPTAIYGDRAWNLKGKPDRPASCAKLKPRQEDDFIAMWDPDKGEEYGTWGSGKHEKGKPVIMEGQQLQDLDGNPLFHYGVGSIALYQYNSRKELVYICNCSSGMDYGFQGALRKEDFPFCCKIEYVERTYISDGDKTNALRHPTFVQVRTDKRVSECVNPRLDVQEVIK